jgi:hypothetical protein
MTIELKVTFDGTAPGLAAGRLSIAAFGDSLDRMLKALRATASAVITGSEPPAYAHFKNDAKLDLELSSIENNCVALKFDCVDPLEGSRPMPDVAARSVAAFLKAVKADTENPGSSGSPLVQRYVEKLPAGISRQRYSAYRDGVKLYSVDCGPPPMAVKAKAGPRLLQLRGHVIGVSFAPDPLAVWFRSGDSAVKFPATADQVDGALALRDADALLAGIVAAEADKNRLLWLRAESDAAQMPSVGDTTSYAAENWRTTLDILAR